MDLHWSAEAFVRVHGLAAQVLIETVRRVVDYARELVSGAKALELLGTDLVE